MATVIDPNVSRILTEETIQSLWTYAEILAEGDLSDQDQINATRARDSLVAWAETDPVIGHLFH